MSVRSYVASLCFYTLGTAGRKVSC